MDRRHPLAALVAPEILAAAAPQEMPIVGAIRLAWTAGKTPSPAGEADEDYRLIPIG